VEREAAGLDSRFPDVAWHARAVRASLEAYAGWASEPARRFRSGAAFLTNGIVEAMEAGGIEVDLTLEPAASLARRAVHVPTSVDVSPIVGRYTAPHKGQIALTEPLPVSEHLAIQPRRVQSRKVEHSHQTETPWGHST